MAQDIIDVTQQEAAPGVLPGGGVGPMHVPDTATRQDRREACRVEAAGGEGGADVPSIAAESEVTPPAVIYRAGQWCPSCQGGRLYWFAEVEGPELRCHLCSREPGVRRDPTAEERARAGGRAEGRYEATNRGGRSLTAHDRRMLGRDDVRDSIQRRLADRAAAARLPRRLEAAAS